MSDQKTEPKAEMKTATRPIKMAIKADRIDLVEPVIEVNGYVHLADSGPLQQSKILKPKVAYIAQGMIVIDEYGLAIPLSTVHIVRTR